MKGWFINLERCPDRRASIEVELERCGLPYKRFAAIDGSDGQRACFQSHLSVLQQDRGEPIHVLEDDAILSGYTKAVVEYVVSSGVLDKFDLVHTETLVSPEVMELRELRQSFDKHVQAGTFEVRDITTTYQACMTSYLVGSGRERLMAALERHAVMCALPIDLFIRQEARAGRLKVGCVFPFATSCRYDQPTSMAGRPSDNASHSKRAIDLLRYSFFVDRDFARTADFVAALRAKRDPHQEIIEAVLGFMTSDKFTMF